MTIYFSRVRLNHTRRGTRHLVASAQAMHAAVLGSHPSGVESEDGRVLWRLDRHATHDLELYVVSPTRPDFTGLIEQAGWPTVETWDTTDYDRFLGRLTRGQTWRFRLVANPIRALPTESGRGRVSPCLTVGNQEDWFRAREESWGVSLVDNTSGGDALVVGDRHTTAFSRSTGLAGVSPTGKVSITRASFSGVLEVTDVERLRHALTHGMGRAKAYGCGLMTLAPL